MRMRATTLAVIALVLAAVAGCGAGDDDPAPEIPPQTADNVLDDDYNQSEAESRARAVLGLAEHDVETSPAARIVRRGDEHFAVTMDLRPGRLNIELDEDADGAYVVTRVVVETPDGEDPLVIE